MIDILLDADGVLIDFFSAALDRHGMSELAGGWPAGEWDMHKVMGITEAEFWKPVDCYRFWRFHAKPYPGAFEFYRALCDLGRVTVCTAPSRSPDCAKAKTQVLRQLCGHDVALMIGSRKELMAKPGALLVDDSDANVEKFVAAGGEAYLYPRVWNKDNGMKDLTYADNVGRIVSGIPFLKTKKYMVDRKWEEWKADRRNEK